MYKQCPQVVQKLPNTTPIASQNASQNAFSARQNIFFALIDATGKYGLRYTYRKCSLSRRKMPREKTHIDCPRIKRVMELLREADFASLSDEEKGAVKGEILGFESEIMRFDKRQKEKFFDAALEGSTDCGRAPSSSNMCGSCVLRYKAREARREADAKYNRKRLPAYRRKKPSTPAAEFPATQKVGKDLSLLERAKQRKQILATRKSRKHPRANELFQVKDVRLPLQKWSEISGNSIDRILEICNTPGFSPEDAVNPSLPDWKLEIVRSTKPMQERLKRKTQKMRFALEQAIQVYGDELFRILQASKHFPDRMYVNTLKKLFLEGATQASIADAEGLSREAIRQREARALDSFAREFNLDADISLTDESVAKLKEQLIFANAA